MNKITKTQKETAKTIALTILATAIVAFALGMAFESRANKQIEQARADATAKVVKVDEVKK